LDHSRRHSAHKRIATQVLAETDVTIYQLPENN
jgi:hypothetical protein